MGQSIIVLNCIKNAMLAFIKHTEDFAPVLLQHTHKTLQRKKIKEIKGEFARDLLFFLHFIHLVKTWITPITLLFFILLLSSLENLIKKMFASLSW